MFKKPKDGHELQPPPVASTNPEAVEVLSGLGGTWKTPGIDSADDLEGPGGLGVAARRYSKACSASLSAGRKRPCRGSATNSSVV